MIVEEFLKYVAELLQRSVKWVPGGGTQLVKENLPCGRKVSYLRFCGRVPQHSLGGMLVWRSPRSHRGKRATHIEGTATLNSPNFFFWRIPFLAHVVWVSRFQISSRNGPFLALTNEHMLSPWSWFRDKNRTQTMRFFMRLQEEGSFFFFKVLPLKMNYIADCFFHPFWV